MQLTDKLSHNIISHIRDTDESITRVVSKYRIQTLSSFTEQVSFARSNLSVVTQVFFKPEQDHNYSCRPTVIYTEGPTLAKCAQMQFYVILRPIPVSYTHLTLPTILRV